MTGLTVAIDGPAGVGKSSVSRMIADKLGVPHLDTGAIYRAVTYAVLRAGAAPADESAATLAAAAATIVIDEQGVRVDGEDATNAIRGPEVTEAVSTVSAHAGVRAELLVRQRQWITERGCGVMEGRDIGAEVLPNANYKIFLIARPEVRAKRRHGELSGAELQQVANDLAKRDEADANREVSPTRLANDAIVIDTSDLTLTQVVDKILEHVT